jgi:hypothetical protein
MNYKWTMNGLLNDEWKSIHHMIMSNVGYYDSCILNLGNRIFGAMEFWIHEMEFDVLNLEFENVLNIVWNVIGSIYSSWDCWFIR